jgi:hypothetical protein
MKYAISLVLVFINFSCSTLSLTARKDKDISLNSLNADKLIGSYYSIDTIKGAIDTTRIVIETVNKNQLIYRYYNLDTPMTKIICKGRFRNGYFQVRPSWGVNFVFGPLFWILEDNAFCIGLSRNQELVFLKAYPGGVAFLLAAPVGAAGGGQYEEIFKRRID